MRFSSAEYGPNKLVLGLFFSLALGSWWLRQMVDEKGDHGPSAFHTPDYWVEKLSARTMDAQGHLQRVMEAERMQHFPDDDSANLVKPRMDFLEPASPPWRVSADTGWVAPGGDTVLLKGVVTVNREAASGIAAAHLVTRDLRVRPKDEYAETEQPVQMQSGNNHVQSRGLRIWLKRPVRIILPAEVRAHYEVTQ